eukprot:4485252-Amphidinium_carterae.1
MAEMKGSEKYESSNSNTSVKNTQIIVQMVNGDEVTMSVSKRAKKSGAQSSNTAATAATGLE